MSHRGGRVCYIVNCNNINVSYKFGVRRSAERVRRLLIVGRLVEGTLE